MRLLLLCCVLYLIGRGAEIAAVRTASASDLVPLWDCWFFTYPAGAAAVPNLVLGYNNTQDFELAVPDSAENRLDPPQFNGYQPFIFKPGLNRFSTVLQDTRGVLAGTANVSGSITWQLGDRLLTIDQQSLGADQRCDVKYEGACPTWVDGFCDDTLYCNGQESCFTAITAYRQMFAKVMGRCQPPLEGVRCAPSEVCNETARACVLDAPTPPPPVSIVPLLNCWYYASAVSLTNSNTAIGTHNTMDGVSGRAPMHVHLVLSYNNTSPLTVARGVTLPGDTSSDAKNQLQPDVYNTLQPTIFSPGWQQAAFTLVDSLDVLRQQGATITWWLTDRQLVVRATDLTDELLCAGADGTRAPTGPTTTSAPSSSPDTPVGDDDVLPQQCSLSNMDCSAYNSFCNGPTHCDLESGYCVLTDPLYTPCSGTRQRMRPGVDLVLQCVEHTSLCVAVASSCVKDRDCNDGFICNGPERCVNETCVALANQTVASVCQYTNAICIEGVGCRATDQLDGRIVFGATLGAIGALALVLFLFYLWRGRAAAAPAPLDTKTHVM
jgi:hypothetical protein